MTQKEEEVQFPAAQFSPGESVDELFPSDSTIYVPSILSTETKVKNKKQDPQDHQEDEASSFNNLRRMQNYSRSILTRRPYEIFVNQRAWSESERSGDLENIEAEEEAELCCNGYIVYYPSLVAVNLLILVSFPFSSNCDNSSADDIWMFNMSPGLWFSCHRTFSFSFELYWK